ncbi:hypothetical protein M011DRAFT_257569 [Sporormia fimetaria CBS 119925]|uniref:Uncharacterized protein n=1 Tax=Sporormia fimetaria CBS 119925 TaxID=1340428 RepID=A0A6A6UXB1_9PLEO|nr:hypothetical protein M011DRAFT_257569 [Sporormia fimetaria CBS 119925]
MQQSNAELAGMVVLIYCRPRWLHEERVRSSGSAAVPRGHSDWLKPPRLMADDGQLVVSPSIPPTGWQPSHSARCASCSMAQLFVPRPATFFLLLIEKMFQAQLLCAWRVPALEGLDGATLNFPAPDRSAPARGYPKGILATSAPTANTKSPSPTQRLHCAASPRLQALSLRVRRTTEPQFGCATACLSRMPEFQPRASVCGRLAVSRPLSRTAPRHSPVLLLWSSQHTTAGARCCQ